MKILILMCDLTLAH